MERPLGPREGDIAVEIFVVQLAELVRLGVLLPVGPHDAHAGEVFVDVAREDAELVLDGERADVDLLPQRHHHQRQPEEGSERQQGETGAHGQHDREHQGNPHRRVHRVHQRGAGGHPRREEVVGGPRHEVAGGGAVVEGRGEPLELLEEVVPQVVLHPPAAAVEQLAHPVPGQAAQQGDPDQESGGPGHRGARRAAGDQVDAPLHDLRPDRDQCVGDHDTEHAGGVGSPVRGDVGAERTKFLQHILQCRWVRPRPAS